MPHNANDSEVNEGPLLSPSGPSGTRPEMHNAAAAPATPRRARGVYEHPEDDPEVRHEMEAESPDGAPPEPESWRQGKMVLTVVVITAAVVLMVPLFIIGGPFAVLIGAALVVGYFLLGQAPAWLAGLQRKEDRDQVEQRLGHDPKPGTHRR